MLSRTITLLGIAAVIAVGAGCGSDDGNTTAGSAGSGTSSPATTNEGATTDATASDDAVSTDRAAFIKQADAICQKADEAQATGLDRANEEKPLTKLTKAEQEELLLTVGLEPVKQEVEELADLDPPEGDEDDIEAIVRGMEEAIQVAEDDPNLIRGAGASPFAEVDELSAAYGFKACSEAL